MSETNTILMLVYAKWCGHCVRYLNLGNDVNKSKWVEICESLNKCEDLKNIKLKTIKLEETQLNELVNLDKELSSKKDSNDLINMFNELKQTADITEDIKYSDVLDNVRGFPTIMVLTKSENGLFKPVDKEFTGDRGDAKSLIKYIQECTGCDKTIEGGSYKKKYKKYKQLYTDLLNKQKGGADYENKYRKYKQLYTELLNKQKGGANYENKYRKYKKIYLETLSKHK